jgi:hypothetical protein
MYPILKLGNSANWEMLFEASYQALPHPLLPELLPLDPIAIPVQFTSRIIAIQAGTLEGKPTWVNVGSILRKYYTGISSSPAPDSIVAEWNRLYFNRLNLFRFEQLSANYALEIKPKPWIPDLTIKIWGYTGIDTDNITKKLAQIESAIKNLSN